MKVIPDFENELKALDPKLEIRTNPNAPDISGVYWDGYCAYVGLPANEIFDEKNPNYTDHYGQVHRTRPVVLEMVRSFLNRIENDKEFVDLIKSND